MSLPDHIKLVGVGELMPATYQITLNPLANGAAVEQPQPLVSTLYSTVSHFNLKPCSYEKIQNEKIDCGRVTKPI